MTKKYRVGIIGFAHLHAISNARAGVHLYSTQLLMPILSAEFNLEVMAVLDAALCSTVSGKTETVQNQ